MPYPLLLAALAASAAGTGMEVAGSAESSNAMQAARNAFLTKQQGLQQQATSLFNNTLQKQALPAATQTATAGQNSQNQLVGALTQAAAPVTSSMPVNSQPGYQVTNPAAAVTQAEAGAQRAQQTTAAGKMTGWGDVANQWNLNNAAGMQQLAPIQSKSRGNAAIFPTELDVASHAGDGLSQWGQIVGALGSLGGMFAGTAPAAASALTPLSSITASSYPATYGMLNGVASAAKTAIPAFGNLWSTLY